MAVVFTHFSRWVKSGKHKEPKISKAAAAAASSNVQSYSTDGRNKDSSFIRRRGRMNERRWRNHDEEEMDKEYDMVMVESDCSEWDDLDWSIGWLEPHGLEFQGEVDSENSFAVLVPCYGGGKQQSSSTEGNSYYMEKWMSYLKKS